MAVSLPFGFQITRKPDGVYLSRRPRPRRGVPARRYFDAAQGSDLTASWNSAPLSADQMLLHGLKAVRARSRDQAANNDYGRQFLNSVKRNVVGPAGVVFQSRVLFTDGKADKWASAAIEEAWADWGRPENAAMNGTDSWKVLQDLFMGAVVEDGEAIFQIVRGTVAGPYGFALHQLDPEDLDVRLNTVMEDGRFIRLGIEFNEWRRPVAYHFKVHEGGYLGANGTQYKRIPADDIIHGFVKERVNQSRGVPWMAASLLRMKMLGAFEEAALVNARVGAAKVGVITTPSGAEFQGDDTDPVSGDQIMDAEPGSFIELGSGQSIAGWDPAYPNGEFEAFTKRILKGMSAGLLMDYPSLSGDLEGVNYSSIRAGVYETREGWKIIQAWLIERFNRRVFEAWLVQALLGGKIKLNGQPLRMERFDRYRRANYQGRRWAYVDPQKEINANKAAVELGVCSRSEIIRDRGHDPEEVWAEIEQENQRLKKAGIIAGDVSPAEPEGSDDADE